ncbi:DNA oxidative demethylase AlkB [Ottowia sp.]|uniref:DNA oxidative demethylase AlkB n=1 Tax=Ottowia sp. TaxID=1898956 RepID=UPI003A83ADA3
MTTDLFSPNGPMPGQRTRLGAQAALLHGFALAHMPALWPALQDVLRSAPPRQMRTPGGRLMSAQLTSCGALGWVSDTRGYRYSRTDPSTGLPWPAMPLALRALAESAAAATGLGDYQPDACLINRYAPGARMGLHQDRDEYDLAQPIVSVSLGLSAVFLWGGADRHERPARVPLAHGDVVVFGGVDRLRFHGVVPIAAGDHPLTGAARINLTFRKAGAAGHPA